MAKLSSLKSSSTHRIIVYGGPKTGKTLLAAKLAEYYNLLWFDLENGYETLFQLPKKWQENIELIQLPDTRSYPIAIETCLKVIKGGPVTICNEHGKVACMLCKKAELGEASKAVSVDLVPEIHSDFFVDVELNTLDHNSVVVFDSLTQLSNSAIAFITKGQPDDYKLDYDDWGNLGKLLDIFLSHIQQAGYNVIVISHETEAKTEGKKNVLVPVGGTRNFSRNVAKYFDHVIYAERVNKKHRFSSSSTASTTILTGSRTDVEMESYDDGSLLPIFKPELYPAKETSKDTKAVAPSSNSSTKPIGGNANTKSILDRIKSKK